MNEVRTARRSRGFTLIELLVVIAIIALLGSLMIPAVAGALERAQNVHCLNNLKQIGVSILTYADDHKGLLPAAGAYQGGVRDGFASRISDYALREAFASVVDEPSAKAYYRGAGRLFVCPSNKRAQEDFTKSYVAVCWTIGSSTVENPSQQNDAHWQRSGSRVMRSAFIGHLTSRSFLLVENWMAYTASCGGQAKIWHSGCDIKGWPGWHFLNFPAHGAGAINRQNGQYDPFGHSLTRNILHADGHVLAYNLDPGAATVGDPYYNVPP